MSVAAGGLWKFIERWCRLCGAGAFAPWKVDGRLDLLNSFIERSPNDHLAFGAPGPHFCLGASLARLELRVLFGAMARRFRVLRAQGPPAYLRSNVVAGIKHLPIDLGLDAR